MIFIHNKYRQCLIANSTTFSEEIAQLNEKELVTYIEKNIGEDKELFLFLLDILSLSSFKEHISKSVMSNKFSFSDNNKLLDFVKKLSNAGVKKVSIVKFILQYSIYNQINYNSFEFYELIDSVLHFTEAERKQLQKETILLTFKNDENKAKEFIKMIEDELELISEAEKKYKYFYDFCNHYSELVYDYMKFIDYSKFKQLFLKARQSNNKMFFTHNADNIKVSLVPFPKHQLEKQISTTFLTLAIKNADFEFAKILLSHCFFFSWCEEYEDTKKVRLILLESCEVFADSQEQKDILAKLKKCI